MKLWIVIPAYNEEKRLPGLIKQLLKTKYHKRIIVADDGSSRPVADYLPSSVRVVRHAVNLGKGAALRTGSELAIQHGAEAILLMDADGQHDPSEINRFVKEIGKHQMVFGARYIGEGMPFWRLLGNRLLNKTTAFLYGLKLHDVWCGYRCFRTSIYPKIKWEATDYSVDVEMAINVGKNKFKHTEIFVGTIYHEKGMTGTSMVDGIKLLLELIIWKITRR